MVWLTRFKIDVVCQWFGTKIGATTLTDLDTHDALRLTQCHRSTAVPHSVGLFKHRSGRVMSCCRLTHPAYTRYTRLQRQMWGRLSISYRFKWFMQEWSKAHQQICIGMAKKNQRIKVLEWPSKDLSVWMPKNMNQLNQSIIHSKQWKLLIMSHRKNLLWFIAAKLYKLLNRNGSYLILHFLFFLLHFWKEITAQWKSNVDWSPEVAFT